MGRSSTLNESKIYATVGNCLCDKGGLTLHDIVAQAGVSIGSLYHRFGSREGLLAETWIDAVEAYQEVFLAALQSGKSDAGEQAALATPQFCRSQRQRAIVLACCRKSEFMTDKTPKHLRRQIADINAEAIAVVRQYARREGLSQEACQLALIAFPLGAVRMYLPSRPVPKSIDAHVLAAFRSSMRTART